MKISTISEIGLVRKHLKMQLRFTESQIQKEYNDICSDFLSSITYFIVEKSILETLSCLMKRTFKRRP